MLFTLLALACPWRAAAEASGHKKKLLLPVQAIDTGCEAFLKRNKINGVHECAVSETGTIGSVDGQAYDYALYCIISGWQPAATAAVKCGDHSDAAQRGSSKGLSEATGKQASKNASRTVVR